jgi:hypothetical protein
MSEKPRSVAAASGTESGKKGMNLQQTRANKMNSEKKSHASSGHA